MKDKVVIFTKILTDIMVIGGIILTISIPYTIYVLGQYVEGFAEHYAEMIIIYFILGVIAVMLVRELRKMMKTVIQDNSFVMENVVSLQKMSAYSFLIVCVALIRTIVYVTSAMLVVILVFCIAGLFSRVLSIIFERAIRYKEENDLTI